LKEQPDTRIISQNMHLINDLQWPFKRDLLLTTTTVFFLVFLRHTKLGPEVFFINLSQHKPGTQTCLNGCQLARGWLALGGLRSLLRALVMS